MNPQIPAQHLPARHRRWPRVLLTIAVVVVLIALAAATFMLSYNGIHVLALNSGVSPRLARIYPGILDAALVIACLAALMLREGKWWARWYAWLSIIVMIVIGAGTNAIHAMNVPLPHRETAGVVSAAPWLLLLLAFSLWVTTLRQSRARRAARSAEVPAAEVAGADVRAHSIVPGMRLEPELVPGPEPAPAEETVPIEDPAPAEETMPAAETLDAHARDASAEASTASAASALDYWDTGEDDILDASVVPAAHDTSDPAPAADYGDEVVEYSDEEEAPALRRMRSTPVPPEEDSAEDSADQP